MRLVSQRWLSKALFRNAARTAHIRSELNLPYTSNLDIELFSNLLRPNQKSGAAEAFRGLLNLLTFS